ncbi:Hypothetical predicted protein [Xyrichtys novacula]|uniref:Uncharacterized protein n=1 Tax=Xyrichtys novacula TaxID=13765 RepID=A0AAV1HGA4_XYRNO|nr:Hypothetical predicted protein [Xyrichtys novacula]
MAQGIRRLTGTPEVVEVKVTDWHSGGCGFKPYPRQILKSTSQSTNIKGRNAHPQVRTVSGGAGGMQLTPKYQMLVRRAALVRYPLDTQEILKQILGNQARGEVSPRCFQRGKMGGLSARKSEVAEILKKDDRKLEKFSD